MWWVLLGLLGCTEAEGPFLEDGALDGITEAHNEVRAAHDLLPFVWSETLASIADEWAARLARDLDCDMEHRSGEPVDGLTVGENLYWQWNDPPPPQIADPKDVVEAWASEVVDYDYDTNTCTPNAQCGHYTQIVWRDTEEVGCAYQTCDASGSQVWVCNYWPPGNWVGQWPY